MTKRMTEKQAYSWLIQPGIQATLFHYDRDTNAALKVAIKALKEKVIDKSDNSKILNKVYGKKHEWYYTYTKNGNKIESSCYDWCCMSAEIANYEEQEGVNTEDATKRFWNDVRDYNMQEFDNRVKKYSSFEKALSEGAFDDLRQEYIDTLCQ